MLLLDDTADQYGKDYEFEAPVKLLDKLVHSMVEEPNEEIVVVSQVLAADVNIGYEDIINTQVESKFSFGFMKYRGLCCMEQGEYNVILCLCRFWLLTAPQLRI